MWSNSVGHPRRSRRRTAREELSDMPQTPATAAAIAASLGRLDSAERSAALSTLYDALSGPLYGVALELSGRPEKAHTICFHVFSYLCRNHGEYDPRRGSLLQWVTQLAHRFALLLDDERAVERRTSGLVRSDRLSDEQRRDLARAYFGGLTYYEIARNRGADPQHVAAELSEGLRSLCQTHSTRTPDKRSSECSRPAS
jgi:DNA-directed RNA polymerase specialized sigma24 family protein